MSMISVCLVEGNVQNSFIISLRLLDLIMVITTMFKSYNIFRKCLILFNLRYKQIVLKVRSYSNFRIF